MKERPILFSAPMIRALLAGTKTQTRRIAKWEPYENGVNLAFSGLDAGLYHSGAPHAGWVLRSRGAGGCWNDRTRPLRCPYGAPGDRLWVKETHALIWPGEYPPENPSDNRVEYRADTDGVSRPGEWPDDADDPERPKWKPSIFMPRWASRISLNVTSVRVERLHDITEEDAKAEGVEPFFARFPEIGRDQRITTRELSAEAEHRASFAVLWDEINGDRALWVSNPWVWVVEFAAASAVRAEAA